MQSHIGTLLDLENDPNVFEILMHVTGNRGDMAEMDSRIVRQISKATGVTTGMKRANQGQQEDDSIE